MIRAGLARALRLFVVVAAASAVVSLVLGVVFGADASRSVSVGWYAVGATVLLLGFFASSRGPTRAVEEGSSLRLRARRWATRGEQEDALNLSAVLVLLGVVLIVLGIAVDPRHRLF